MSEGDDILPRGWRFERLDAIATTSSGGTPKSKTPEFYDGEIPWVKIGDLTDGAVDHAEQCITEDGLAASPAKLLPAGTLLLAMYGSIGKLGILSIPAATNQAICAIRPQNDIDPRYLFWYLRSRRSELFAMGRGGTQRNISQADVRALRVAVPPRREQELIVATIEATLSQVEAGVAFFARAARYGTLYERAVLQSAMGNCVVPTNGDEEGGTLPELPATWEWSTVGEEGDVQLGRMLNKERSSGPHLRPYLRVANVLDDRLALSDVKEMDFPPGEYERYLLHPGDILLNEGQSPELLGRAAMYRGEWPGLCFQKTLLRFQAGQRVDPEFALLVFRHYLYAGRFRRESRITTGIGHLTQVRFAALEFPVPPHDEQEEIVRDVRQQLDSAARFDKVIVKAEADAATLKASLLNDAFSGALSRGESGDQPADALHGTVQEFRPRAGSDVRHRRNIGRAVSVGE